MSLLTPAELAAHFKTSERTVARMVLDGCPNMMIGSRRKFDLGAVLAWAQERACQSGKTKKTAGTRKHASGENAYIAASRSVRLRVTPSVSKPS